MKDIIVQHNQANNVTAFNYLFIDDVELYEIADIACDSNRVIENRTYEYEEAPIEASVSITAGRDVLSNNDNGPVICDAKTDNTMGDSRVVYKAGQKIVLKDGFSVKKGAFFRAYLAPCGKECFSPLTNIEDAELFICDDNAHCFNLGGARAFGMTYEWSSNNSQLLGFLNHTDISNPTLCIPANFGLHGTYFLTLKVTNKCGEEAETTIKIFINRDNYGNSDPIIFHKQGNLDWGGFYFNGLPMHIHWYNEFEVYSADEVKLEVFDPNGNVIDSIYWYVGVNYPEWSSANPRPRVVMDYYKEVPCDPNYVFKITLTNKCNNKQEVLSYTSPYRCQYY